MSQLMMYADLLKQAVMVTWGELMCRQQFCQGGAEGPDASASSIAFQQREAFKHIEQYAAGLLRQDHASHKAGSRKGQSSHASPGIEVIAKNFEKHAA